MPILSSKKSKMIDALALSNQETKKRDPKQITLDTLHLNSDKNLDPSTQTNWNTESLATLLAKSKNITKEKFVKIFMDEFNKIRENPDLYEKLLVNFRKTGTLINTGELNEKLRQQGGKHTQKLNNLNTFHQNEINKLKLQHTEKVKETERKIGQLSAQIRNISSDSQNTIANLQKQLQEKKAENKTLSDQLNSTTDSLAETKNKLKELKNTHKTQKKREKELKKDNEALHTIAFNSDQVNLSKLKRTRSLSSLP